MNAVLIRHTRVTVPAGVCYGRTDVALADTFAVEAAALSARLPWAPLIVWTSPATRCRRLADWIAEGKQVHVDARLQELDFGAWEGRPWESFRGPESEAWALDPWRLRPPGGESGDEFIARVAAVRAEMLAAQAERVAVVTHAGVQRIWRLLAERLPPEACWAMPVEFGAIWPAR